MPSSKVHSTGSLSSTAPELHEQAARRIMRADRSSLRRGAPIQAPGCAPSVCDSQGLDDVTSNQSQYRATGTGMVKALKYPVVVQKGPSCEPHTRRKRCNRQRTMPNQRGDSQSLNGKFVQFGNNRLINALVPNPWLGIFRRMQWSGRRRAWKQLFLFRPLNATI